MMTNPSTASRNNPVSRYGLVVTMLVALVVIGGASLYSGLWRTLLTLPPVVYWLAVLVVMAIFMVLVGWAINGRWLGILIDPRYKLSLSRLQITLWTMLVLSAYFAIAMPRIFGGLTDFRSLLADDALLKACRERLVDAAATPDGTDRLKTAVLTAEQCDAGPLQITFPPELILAMGISAASFAGSTLIQSTKQKKVVNFEARNAEIEVAAQKRKAAQDAVDATQQALDDAAAKKASTQKVTDATLAGAKARLSAAAAADKAAAEDALKEVERQAQARNAAAGTAYEDAAAAIEAAQTAFTRADKAYKDLQKAITDAEGLLHKNTDPSQASWSDLFRGDEIGNYKLVDMSKVQMFFFTVVIVLAYGAALAALLGANATILRHPLGVDFPPFSNSLNTLLGISHSGYLAIKTVDQTKTQ